MTHVKRIFLAALLVASGLASQAHAAAINLVTPGAHYSGAGFTVGFRFTVLNNTTLTSLGVYDENQDGITERAQVGLWDAGGNLLVSTFIPAGTAAELDGYFRYESVAGFNLVAGTHYLIASYLVDAITSFNMGDGDVGSVDANVFVIEDRFNQGSDFAVPVDTGGQLNRAAWLGANFRAELPDDNGTVPEPGSIALLGLGIAGLLAARRRPARP